MPIPAELRRALYNRAEWKQQRERVLARAGGRCECRGDCGAFHFAAGDGRCGELYAKRRGAFSVAHRGHNTGERVPDEQLAAFCNGCHLRYDSGQHQQAMRAREQLELEQLGQLRLFSP